uniref:NADH-ubiquinone oxidoreductase chain 4L n=1 Tax=Cephalothrix sp. BMK-2020 TaxID=2741703 RepID=A0A6M8TVK6_9BILA|nr:NADH dehydrogenase subunit 4L [Cephalothrix sp. BMK-2020]
MFINTFFDFFFVGTIVVIISLFTMLIQRIHLLMVLLCLEMIMLGLFFFSCSFFGYCGGSCYISFVLLSFSACEASVGLSLLVALIRSHGKDFISLFCGYSC